ncbi:hypothetical protein [Mucilaginibacter sp. CSA2-8R]
MLLRTDNAQVAGSSPARTPAKRVVAQLVEQENVHWLPVTL